MKYYMYIEPAGSSSEPVYTIMSEKAILASYWSRWSSKMPVPDMLEKEVHELEQRCIEDYCAINWATECNEKTLAAIFLSAPNSEKS